MPARAASLVDGHVHLHDCFEVSEFLDAAAANFAAAAKRLGLPREPDRLHAAGGVAGRRPVRAARRRHGVERGLAGEPDRGAGLLDRTPAGRLADRAGRRPADRLARTPRGPGDRHPCDLRRRPPARRGACRGERRGCRCGRALGRRQMAGRARPADRRSARAGPRPAAVRRRQWRPARARAATQAVRKGAAPRRAGARGQRPAAIAGSARQGGRLRLRGRGGSRRKSAFRSAQRLPRKPRDLAPDVRQSGEPAGLRARRSWRCRCKSGSGRGRIEHGSGAA